MAKRRTRGSASLPSWKKKRWFQLIAPKMFNNQVLGETLVAESGQMMGKSIKLSMMSLTGDMKKQHINIKFEVVGIAENNAQTRAVGYEFAPSSIKRLVRRRRKRVDDSFICSTKDNIRVRMKPFFVTRQDTNKSTLTSMRKLGKDFIAKFAKERNFDDLTYDIIDHRMQRDLKKVLSKVYPLRTCEVRTFSVVKERKIGGEEMPAPVAEKPKEEKKEKPKKEKKAKKEKAEKKPKKEKPVKEEKPEPKEETKEEEKPEEKPAEEEKKVEEPKKEEAAPEETQ